MPGAAASWPPPSRAASSRCATTWTWSWSMSTYTDGSAERYQVIVSWDSEPVRRVQHVATIGADGDRTGLRRAVRPGCRSISAVADRHVGQPGRRAFGKEPDVDAAAGGVSAGVGRRAEQHQRDLRARRHLQGVSPGQPRHQPRYRAEPGARPGRKPACGPTAGHLRADVGRRRYDSPAGHGDRVRGQRGRRLGDGHRQRP